MCGQGTVRNLVHSSKLCHGKSLLQKENKVLKTKQNNDGLML